MKPAFLHDLIVFTPALRGKRHMADVALKQDSYLLLYFTPVIPTRPSLDPAHQHAMAPRPIDDLPPPLVISC